jgi:hypothetical protein
MRFQLGLKGEAPRSLKFSITAAGSDGRCNTPLVIRFGNTFERTDPLGLQFAFT